MESLTVDQWRDLFASTTRDAFHLELRDSYGVPSEAEAFSRWLAGQPESWEETAKGFTPWAARVKALVRAGAAVRRLRVVTEPVTDYIRFEHHDTPHNLAAGEDIRWLPRHRLPDGIVFPCEGRDFWLLDDRYAIFGRFDDTGRPTGKELATEPAVVAEAIRVRDRLWPAGIPHDEYRPVTAV